MSAKKTHNKLQQQHMYKKKEIHNQQNTHCQFETNIIMIWSETLTILNLISFPNQT